MVIRETAAGSGLYDVINGIKIADNLTLAEAKEFVWRVYGRGYVKSLTDRYNATVGRSKKGMKRLSPESAMAKRKTRFWKTVAIQ